MGDAPVDDDDRRVSDRALERTRPLLPDFVLDARDPEPIACRPPPYRPTQALSQNLGEGPLVGFNRDDVPSALNGLKGLHPGCEDEARTRIPQQLRERSNEVTMGLARTAIDAERGCLGRFLVNSTLGIDSLNSG
jgi:hypothetical protein